MDLSQSIQPNSDQVNADDLIAGDRNVTITGVEAGSSEQPVFIHLAEFPGRTYRPSKSMRRVMVAAWGPDANTYNGRRMTLYRDPNVTFGREKVGGIKISALSNIDKPLEVSLTATRGKRAVHTVKPLAEAPVDPSRALAAFEQLGVSTSNLEAHLGKRVDEWTPQDMSVLHDYYGQVKNESVDTATDEVLEEQA